MIHKSKKEEEILKNNTGFTIVETLVAISILLLVILGPMTIAMKGMQMGFYANEQTTAVFLAQEAIESIQSLRDDNALGAAKIPQTSIDTWEWYDSLPTACRINLDADDSGCDLDITDGSYHSCSDITQCKLKKPTSGNYIYNYTSGAPASIYTRVIRVEPLGANPNEIAAEVTVTVTWTAQNGLFSTPTRTVTLQTYVYDHYKHYEP